MPFDGGGRLSDSQKARLNASPCQEPYDSGMHVRIDSHSQQGFLVESVYKRPIKKKPADGRRN